MANKFTNRPDFEIPESIIDEHEWVSDEFIDGPFGKNCLLEYHQVDSECINCYFDIETKRSTNIFKTGGPMPFANYTTCPRCGGTGRITIAPITESIKLRVYWKKNNSWGKSNDGQAIFLAYPDSDCRVIGYMSDLPKVERAAFILVQSDQQAIRRWRCERNGEAFPHGFRGNRYFQQFLKRVGGG